MIKFKEDDGMNSTDHNLNNPMSVDLIDLPRLVDYWHLPSIEYCTMDAYRLKEKDPYKIYVITDSEDGRYYYGKCLILREKNSCKYYIGEEYNDDKHGIEYCLYMNSRKDNSDNLIKICKFDDPTSAIKTLSTFNKIGSHEAKYIEIYDLVTMYIDRNIGIHDFIISCLCAFGYREHPDLQKTIQMFISYGGDSRNYDIPMLLREKIVQIADVGHMPVITLYSKIYNIICKYNYFKDGITKANFKLMQNCIYDIISCFE